MNGTRYDMYLGGRSDAPIRQPIRVHFNTFDRERGGSRGDFSKINTAAIVQGSHILHEVAS